ncbi:hypothetical protein RND81_12G201800 [Saponaria officinalis]|uniref:Pectinesterase n=1 Tax=Saponaria officinalis TaxID=3572 RepID=A0AAW1HD50_SAPOF
MASQSYNKKILLFFLTIVTLISLSYLGLVTIKAYNSNPIEIISLCGKSHDLTSCLALINEAIFPNELETTSFSSDDGRKMLGKILSKHALDINKVIYGTKLSNVHTKSDQAISDCLELMDLSHERVFDSIKILAKNIKNNNKNKYYYEQNDDINIRTWLSAVLTNHVTCLDQLENESHLLGLKSKVEDLIQKGRALLSIHAKVCVKDLGGGENFGRKIRNGQLYPSWLRRSDRKLLGVSGSDVVADVVVAKDGSGNFTTVAEAVASAPDKGKNRYVIYVKEGVYVENIEVGKKKKNVMMVGDGMNLTIITGSENVFDGNTTFRSATLAAVGERFILQDICIQNTAGPEKHQAVALRVGADQSVINRCKLDAYQDTLYAHSLRQFYTNSLITGTVDFIFGNAAVVFQNCQLVARKPMTSQKNMVTAQGRTDPNQNTGTSIQYCDIVASADLEPVTAQFPTFLGRPWKNFSRTVVMQSNIGDLIDPAGWSKWDGDFALDTLYYAEYMNSGPGSDTSMRVNWTGYHILNDPSEAKPFTVGEFIQGQEWLDEAGVTFVEGL